ncbi:hypothetical protein AbraIFM66950_007574 [Aspergillus brasiliensis]|nr:hypothetical protein AbraIFM66950_007574 [Aspergillus brasiliensis]
MKKTQELENFKSSLFISDLERIFNSTAYAIANSGSDAPACDDYSVETITGQTTLPGEIIVSRMFLRGKIVLVLLEGLRI